MNEIIRRKMQSYREAVSIAKGIGPQCSDTREFERHYHELEDLERAYHYAQRYLHLFVPAVPGTSPPAATKAKARASFELALEVIGNLVDQECEGLGYNGSTLKYVALPKGFPWQEDPVFKKLKMSQTFPWCENAWFILHASEKMAGSIRRVKAKTEQEVLDRLFVKVPADVYYRFFDPHVYYVEYRSNDEAFVKVYWQRKTVDYADYRVDLYYISPFDLVNAEGEALITALKRNAPIDGLEQFQLI